MTSNVPDWLLPSIAAILAPGSLAEALKLNLSPIVGGSNNRVFRVECGPQFYFAKWYFIAPEDPRDRLQAEWKFTQFAWRHGLRNLAEPIGRDADRGIAIYAHLPGRRLAASEIKQEHVCAAVEFLLELNRHRDSPDAKDLPLASESCFSIAAHLDCIRRRVQQLQEAVAKQTVSEQSRRFVESRLAKIANLVETSIWQRLATGKQSAISDLPSHERIVSPSDFGFHNAFLDADGQLRFFDFEYAGWDDPAKTICDFFSQIAVPVPPEFWPDFVRKLGAMGGADIAWRADLLRPLYRIKWCCIVLNPLMRLGRERRQFSGGHDAGITESECLDRAEHILASIPEQVING